MIRKRMQRSGVSSLMTQRIKIKPTFTVASLLTAEATLTDLHFIQMYIKINVAFELWNPKVLSCLSFNHFFSFNYSLCLSVVFAAWSYQLLYLFHLSSFVTWGKLSIATEENRSVMLFVLVLHDWELIFRGDFMPSCRQQCQWKPGLQGITLNAHGVIIL